MTVRRSLFAALFTALFAVLLPRAAPAQDSVNLARLRSALSSDLTSYLRSRRTAEHISAVSLTVSLPRSGPTFDVVTGTTTYGGTTKITPRSLFQIGSNTKAFTSVALLQLEAEHRLSIEQTVGRWLPQYPAFRNVTIHQLLDMTSGIENYSNVPAMLSSYAADPYHDFSAAALVAYADPKNRTPVTSGKGWSYTNTAYILGQMIIERVTGHTYTDEIHRRFLTPRVGLTDTYYQPAHYPAPVMNRLISGYFWNDDPSEAPLKPVYGHDVKPYSLSWTQGAGGIISTPHQVTQWVRQLYGGQLLAKRQQRELQTMVSNKTGRAIATTTSSDRLGFGLGVGQVMDTVAGKTWFYQGETLGYRVIYAYIPKSDLAFTIGLNSQPAEKENHVQALVHSVYRTLKRNGAI